MSSESLINRYRPTKFSQVVGQDEVVKSFRIALEDKISHAFLFTGPSGIGKTTLSSLGAKFVGCVNKPNLIEVDAATYNGVDDFRGLTENLRSRPLGGVSKALIIDECHSLSRQAWQSALKMVEEPPDWVYWFFCTTELAKVPDTIKSRCSSYILKPLRVTEIFDYLLYIVAEEKFDTPKTIVELCAKQSDGSPRKALSNLSVCYSAVDRQEAAVLIANFEATELGTPFALAKAIADGWKWPKIQPLLESMAEKENPETIRHTVRAYFTKIIITTNDEKTVCSALKVLDNFSEPFNSSDGFTPVVIAVGRSLF